VYSYDIRPEAREYADSMPIAALASYAELIGFMELTPWGRTRLPTGQTQRQHAQDALRTWLRGHRRLPHPRGATPRDHPQRDMGRL